MITGSEPFDVGEDIDGDAPGNDAGPDDDRVRTFDTVKYTVAVETALRNAVGNTNCGGFKTGRIHFQIVLPVGAEQARIEIGSMAWLRTYPGVACESNVVETTDASGRRIQVLRGSFLLTPADSAEVAISGTRTFEVIIRVLNMTNEDKLAPEITVWLAHNNVGAEFAEGDTEKLIHTNVITATTHSCTNVDEKENQPGVEGDVHGYEAKTCEVEPVTISAALRYNVALEIAYPSTSSKKGTFDFSVGLPGQVPNYIAADENESHLIDGRIYGIGVTLELRGKSGWGLRGIQLPTWPIELYIDLYTEVWGKKLTEPQKKRM